MCPYLVGNGGQDPPQYDGVLGELERSIDKAYVHRRSQSRWATRRSAVLSGAKPGHSLLDSGADQGVVVPGDEPVDPSLQQGAGDRVKRLVGLAELDPRPVASQIDQAVPTGRLRPER